MSPDTSDGDPASRARRRPRIIDVSTLTAVAGLAVALIFNALQVKDTANQERATKRATQLELLTELNGLVTQSQTKVIPLSSEFVRAVHGSGTLSTGTNTNFAQTLSNVNYLAWLFNNGFLDIPGARELWIRPLECLDATAHLVYGPKARPLLVSLDRFVHIGTGNAIWRLRRATCS